MVRDIRIALVACRSVTGDTTGNLAGIKHWAAAAKQQGAELVCFPELSATGYHIREPIGAAAETIPGPASEFIAQISATHNISILAGIAEKSGSKIYASHILAKPDTGVAGVYRKLHLGPPEQKVFTRGTKIPPLFQTRGLCLGVQLCYDAHFPGLSTKMAVNGADILFIPHASPGNSPEDKMASWMRHLTARAFDNSVYVAAVNAAKDNGCGLCFPAVAMLISPEGKVIDSYAGMDENMLVADLSLDLLQAVRAHPMKYFLPNQRPDLY